MEDRKELMANLLLELRRGSLTLCVFSQLMKPQYGYSLLESMEKKGIVLEPGTLYPLLRRLEKQGLLNSEWETAGAKPRKYYVINQAGREVYQALQKEWKDMSEGIDRMIREGSMENG